MPSKQPKLGEIGSIGNRHDSQGQRPFADQKTLIEGLLGRSVSEDEAISIRTMGSGGAPDWLQASWDSAKRSGVDQLSMDEIDAEIDGARRERHSRRQPTEQ